MQTTRTSHRLKNESRKSISKWNSKRNLKKNAKSKSVKKSVAAKKSRSVASAKPKKPKSVQNASAWSVNKRRKRNRSKLLY